ncbi:MAG: BON domain-containing protein [Burkholderiaceae bacterium]
MTARMAAARAVGVGAAAATATATAAATAAATVVTAVALSLAAAVLAAPAAAQMTQPSSKGSAARQRVCAAGEPSLFRDQALAIKVATRLQFNKSLLREKVDVHVAGGVATLSGNVTAREHIALAVKLASEVDGVRCVNNFLKIGAPEPSDPGPSNL